MNNETRHGGGIMDLAREKGMRIQDILDFSSSLNDFMDPPRLCDFIDPDSVGAYPGSDSDLREKIASYSGVSPDNIILGPGLSYFIFRMAELYRDSEVLLFRPAFSEYSRAFKAHGLRISHSTADEAWPLMDSVKKGKYSMVCLNRPDTPTGNMMPENLVCRMAEACDSSGTTMFIDEAFIDFLPGEAMKFSASIVKDHPSVVLGRSLTKIFSAPSLRAGYLISSGEVPGRIRQLMEPWTLGNHILEYFSHMDFDSLRSCSARVKIEREYLIGMMNSLGFSAVGEPAANYVTFRSRSGIDPASMFMFLRNRGILVRTLEDFPEFGPGSFRVAVKMRDKTDRLIADLKEYLDRGET
jgi:threonine-phosphate decarboxylase